MQPALRGEQAVLIHGGHPSMRMGLWILLWAGALLLTIASCDSIKPVDDPPPKRIATSGPTADSSAPATTADKAGTGKETYTKHCQSCHGEKGDRVLPVRLDSRTFLEERGEKRLGDTVASGIGLMRGLSKAKGGALQEQDVREVVSYLLATSADRPEPATAGVPPPAAPKGGTPEPFVPVSTLARLGKDVYSGTCAACHNDPADIASKATRANVERMAIGLDERQTSTVFEYLRSLSASRPAPTITGTVPAGRPAAAVPGQGKAPAEVRHAIEGQDGKCLDCHNVGRAKPFPVSHRGRTNDMCLLCHLKAQSLR